MALKMYGQGRSTEGFDFRNGFAYQMVPQSGMPRIVYFETDHSDWIMARNEDVIDGVALGGAQAFDVDRIQRSGMPEVLAGRWEAFRLPKNSQFAFGFKGRGMTGQFEYKLQPVNKHTSPIRFRISVLPPVTIKYVAFVILSDAVMAADVNFEEMGRAFTRAEEAYKIQCNIDLVRVATAWTPSPYDPPRHLNVRPVRSDFLLGNPINLGERWEALKVELNKGLSADEQKLLKCVISWNVLTGDKKKANKWVDDAVGVSMDDTICFAETELTDEKGSQYPEWTTIAHEIGHSLKLKHTDGQAARVNVMWNGSTGPGFSNRFFWFQIEKLNGTFAYKLNPAWFY